MPFHNCSNVWNDCLQYKKLKPSQFLRLISTMWDLGMLSSGKLKPLWSIFSRMVVKLSTSACKAQKWEEKRKRKIPISLMSCSLVLHQKKGLRWDNSNEGYFSSGRNKRERALTCCWETTLSQGGISVRAFWLVYGWAALDSLSPQLQLRRLVATFSFIVDVLVDLSFKRSFFCSALLLVVIHLVPKGQLGACRRLHAKCSQGA